MSYFLHEDRTFYWIEQYEKDAERLNEMEYGDLLNLSRSIDRLMYYPQAHGAHERIWKLKEKVSDRFHEVDMAMQEVS